MLSACGGRSNAPTTYALRSLETSAGRMVVTGPGRTVYIYLPDPTRPSESTCTGDCANDWPPVLSTGTELRVSGLDKSQIGSVTRADGSRQLTYYGYPLYRFAGDRRPGDIRGESVGNTWFAIDPHGQFVPLAPATFTPSQGRTAGPVRVIVSPDGPVLADGNGQTLYTFRDDSGSASACTPAWCVQDWPPLLVPKAPPIAAGGVLARIGALRRSDGTLQVTISGHPVYRFAGDYFPGDLRGLGIGGDWYPITPRGTRLAATTPTTTAKCHSGWPPVTAVLPADP